MLAIEDGERIGSDRTAPKNKEKEGELTLSPFPSAIRDLTLDYLEHVELKGRMRDLENSLQDSLYPKRA